MLRCIVADDEPLAKMLLESYIGRTDGLMLVGGFTSATEAREAIRNRAADVAFLDIQMPGINGLELAAEAEKNGVRVIFTTAYRDYALDGFRVNALDYLLKPVSYDEFLVAANRALTALQVPSEHGYITVKSNYQTVKILRDDIVYVEGLRDYVKLHLHNGRDVITQMSMKAAAEMLGSNGFVRVHRSYIVALDAIRSFSRSAVTVGTAHSAENLSLPIGDTFRASFSEAIEGRETIIKHQ